METPLFKTVYSPNTGNYEISKQVGSGTFATVWLAYHKDHSEGVAIKRTDKHASKEDQNRVVERARLEGSVLYKLTPHPNLIGIFDEFETFEYHYLVLELAKDGDLLTYLNNKAKGPLSDREAKKVVLQIGKGLKYMHDHGYCHRDIKCENILLFDRLDYIKITDLGFVSEFKIGVSQQSSLGSLHYASPEVIGVGVMECEGPESDVWSLGVITYVLVCGKFPFGDSKHDPADVAVQIREGKIPELPEKTSPLVGDLIRAMLNPNGRERIKMDGIMNHPWLVVPTLNIIPKTGSADKSSSPSSSNSSSPFGTPPKKSSFLTKKNSFLNKKNVDSNLETKRRNSSDSLSSESKMDRLKSFIVNIFDK